MPKTCQDTKDDQARALSAARLCNSLHEELCEISVIYLYCFASLNHVYLFSIVSTEFEIALSSSEVIFAFFKFVHSYSLALCMFTLFSKIQKSQSKIKGAVREEEKRKTTETLHGCSEGGD